MQNYNYPAIRKLVEAAFDDEDLQIFCYDHFSDVAEMFTTGQTKRARVQMLIDYVRRHGLTDRLLGEIRAANPYQYEKFEHGLREDVSRAPSGTHVQVGISFEMKTKVVDALLSCDSMSDRNSRNAVVNELRSDIKSSIRRNNADRIDVVNIVSRCLDFPDGINELVSILRVFEGESIGMQYVERVIQEANTYQYKKFEHGLREDIPLSQKESVLPLRSEPLTVFVPGYKNDIFVSYDPAPNVSDEWVSYIVKRLRDSISQELGGRDVFSLQMSQLSYGRELLDTVKNTAIIVVILSKSYLVSKNCQIEKDAFLRAVAGAPRNTSRVFIVERDKIEKENQPAEFRDKLGYQFWMDDSEGKPPRTLGYPKPNSKDELYYRKLNDLSYDITKELKCLKTLATTKVFISYASNDLDIAKKLYNDLKNEGLKPWMDTEDILPGQDWKEKTRQAIKDSSFFIALLSSNSLKERGYVQKEQKIALEMLDEFPSSEIFIIPARLDDCKPLNEKLQAIKFADLFPCDNYKRGLSQILRVLKNSAEEHCVESDEPDTRTTVFLAEVTQDLFKERDEVKRYLDQAGFRVLPHRRLFSIETDVCKQSVESKLQGCNFFVQLLSGLPYKMYPDLPCYSHIQYECAVNTGMKIFQWRIPSLNMNTIEDKDHRELLERSTVLTVNLEEFKREVVRYLQIKPVQKTDFSTDAFVFLNANNEDRLLAQDISKVMEQKEVGYALPLWDEHVAGIFEDSQKNLFICDGVIVVYGKADILWVRDQVREYRKTMSRREQPLKALAVYEGPPEQKKELNMKLPDMYVINCRERLDEQAFHPFLNALKEGN